MIVERNAMIDRTHDLPAGGKLETGTLSLGGLLPAQPVSAEDLALMRQSDEIHLEWPFAGIRILSQMLPREGRPVGRRHVSALMKRTEIHALYRKPGSKRHRAHKVYPYLWRYLTITRSNHGWSTDIAYTPMKRGFVYLFEALDWSSSRVLSWCVSNTIDYRLPSRCGPGIPSQLGCTGHLQHRPRVSVHHPP